MEARGQIQQTCLLRSIVQSSRKQCHYLIPIGNIQNLNFSLGSELSRALQGRELLVNDLRQTSRCATQLLVTSRGVATRTQLAQLRQQLALQGTPLAGWVLLDPELELG